MNYFEKSKPRKNISLKYEGISVPLSEPWHKDLLDLSIDRQIISFGLSRKLDEYRAFRHFFVHGYGITSDYLKTLGK